MRSSWRAGPLDAVELAGWCSGVAGQPGSDYQWRSAGRWRRPPETSARFGVDYVGHGRPPPRCLSSAGASRAVVDPEWRAARCRAPQPVRCPGPDSGTCAGRRAMTRDWNEGAHPRSASLVSDLDAGRDPLRHRPGMGRRSGSPPGRGDDAHRCGRPPATGRRSSDSRRRATEWPGGPGRWRRRCRLASGRTRPCRRE